MRIGMTTAEIARRGLAPPGEARRDRARRRGRARPRRRRWRRARRGSTGVEADGHARAGVVDGDLVEAVAALRDSARDAHRALRERELHAARALARGDRDGAERVGEGRARRARPSARCGRGMTCGYGGNCASTSFTLNWMPAQLEERVRAALRDREARASVPGLRAFAFASFVAQAREARGSP